MGLGIKTAICYNRGDICEYVTPFYVERENVMIKTEEFYFDSRDNIHKIHAMKWIPEDGACKAVLQIAHGMAEHIKRYDDFARYMAERGFLVVANDHLGHGQSTAIKEDYGYFAPNDAVTVVVRDIHRLKKLTQEENPGKPYFILGHSMGSFMLRNYLCRYGKGIDGAIVMATGSKPTGTIKSGKLLARLIVCFRGWKHISPAMNKMVDGHNNDQITDQRTEYDWLSRDQEIVDRYIEDEECGFPFTLNGVYTIADAIDNLHKKDYLDKMPRDLPILFLSGEKDPIGHWGQDVPLLAKQFEDMGMQKISMKMYPECRHELLNELDREEVYEDICGWLEKQMAAEK